MHFSDQDSLFDLPGRESGGYGPGSGRKAWGGNDSAKARAKCRAMLPWPCKSCGGLITADDPESTWHAGHVIDRVAGGTDDDVEPEHAKCNTSSGGRIGAAMTNAKKGRGRPAPIQRERTPQWW
ncbi:hypothetical protein [Arthrobacter woluwensis]|uniref:hypothetical protein n=1 Tax=Arthrobacter woluwensis TaxID=156980 RepID=UPI0011A11BD0|nr:hypothetical protein [Arthrobacter woluwensis]